MTFARNRQKDVDVLVGSNRDEGTFLFRGGATVESYLKDVRERWGDLADAYLAIYSAASDAEANQATLHAWNDEVSWLMRTWAQQQTKHGKARAYAYFFTQVPPVAEGQQSRGATHTAELEYVFNNMLPNRSWTAADRALADTMSSYWVNFARIGNPNGAGLPAWPAYRDMARSRPMVLGANSAPGTPADQRKDALFSALWAKQMAASTADPTARTD